MATDSAGKGALGPARNLVILCLDTLRTDHVGAYGYPRDTTPNIDAVAAEGTLFERVTAQSNWTVPATASLLTSRYPSEHGAEVHGEVRYLETTWPSQIRQSVPTLAEILQGAGFQTALFSANPYLSGSFMSGFGSGVVGKKTAADLTDLALGWLEAKHASRFFLYVQYIDLHHPVTPPPPFFDFFSSEAPGKLGPEHSDWRYARHDNWKDPDFRSYKAGKIAVYDGALRYVDQEIGRILALLERLDVLEDTLLVITSDHGEEFWDHAELERRLGGNPRGRWGIGHGHSMFQELLWVPLILRGPGVAGGRSIDCEARHIDVVPTALEMLALASTAFLRGRSVSSWLDPASDPPGPCPERLAIAESPAYGPDSQALVLKQHKLIRRNDGVRLLYDLRRDPKEWNDLAAGRPELVAKLTTILDRELAEIRSNDLSKPEEMTFGPEALEQLRALGYVQ